ncbi:hypothetical protein ACOSQ3_010792 [Xanthoceras sorbifolium]
MNSRTSCTQMVQHCGDGFMQIGLITRTSSHASVHHTLSAGMFTHLVLRFTPYIFLSTRSMVSTYCMSSSIIT